MDTAECDLATVLEESNLKIVYIFELQDIQERED
jgi:hypothetical protein